MNEILPAIISKDSDELQEKLDKVDGVAGWVQIDIMDGVFVPPVTWSCPDDLDQIKTDLHLEMHFMVQNPEDQIESWLHKKVKRILVHEESTDHNNIFKIIDTVKSAGIEVGLVLKIETQISVLEGFIDKIDAVQLMSIDKIGYYGQTFDARVIPKILSLREKFPSVKIEVDGGINFESAKEVLKAGADRLAIGSSIFKSENIKETIKKFQSL